MYFKSFELSILLALNTFFNIKKSLKSYNWFQTFFTTETCSLGGHDGKTNHIKISKTLKLNQKTKREGISLFYQLIRFFLCSLGSNFLALSTSHMWTKKSCK